MSRERVVNQGTTALNGAINDSTTSVVVNSASNFPSSPQFRIVVSDSEIMLVTGISGDTFTTTRGAESTAAVSHFDSASVAQVLTKEGTQRFQRDWNNPFFDSGTPQQLLDLSGNTLTASSFTDINMANASKTDQTGGGILLQHDTQSAANDIAIIKKSAPTAPWTLTVGFIPNLLNEVSDFPSCGPVVRDNSTGELYHFFIQMRDDGLWVLCPKFASPTASSTTFLTARDWSGGSGVVWFQIEDNNTNLIFRLSADGVNFLTFGQEARLTFLTPDEIGFAVNNFGGANIEAMVTLVAWNES